MPATCLCFRCPAKCCRYLALEIDKPVKAAGYERIAWLVSHRDVFVFVEDGKWFAHLNTTCANLAADNRCGIYQRRPQICRDYSNTDCDFSGHDYQWQATLHTPEQVADYARRHAGVAALSVPRLAQPAWSTATAAATRRPSRLDLLACAPSAQPAAARPSAARKVPLPVSRLGGHHTDHKPPDTRHTLAVDLLDTPDLDSLRPVLEAPAFAVPTFGEPPRDHPAGPAHELPVFIDAPQSPDDLDNLRWYVMHDRVRIRVDADDRWTLLYRTSPKPRQPLTPAANPFWDFGHQYCQTAGGSGPSCQPTPDAGPGAYPRVFADEAPLVEFVRGYLAGRPEG